MSSKLDLQVTIEEDKAPLLFISRKGAEHTWQALDSML
jgi:hypothetical protein